MYNPLKPSKKLKARPLDSRTADAQKKTAMQQQNQKRIREMVDNPYDSVEKLGFKTGDILLQFAVEKIPTEIKNSEDADLLLTELGIAAHAWNLFVMNETNVANTPNIRLFNHTKKLLTSTHIDYYKNRFNASFSHHKFIIIDCEDFSWHPKSGYNVDLMCVVIE
jgi:hypothetical protein